MLLATLSSMCRWRFLPGGRGYLIAEGNNTSRTVHIEMHIGGCFDEDLVLPRSATFLQHHFSFLSILNIQLNRTLFQAIS